MTWKVHIEHFYISSPTAQGKLWTEWAELTNLFFMQHNWYLKEWMMQKDLYNLVK